jgi:hypothetical protein
MEKIENKMYIYTREDAAYLMANSSELTPEIERECTS